MASETIDSKEWPNMYDEAHDMLIIASAMFFLSKMRILAKAGKLPDQETADSLLELPITTEDIINAMESKANKDVICEVEGETDFGLKLGMERLQLHRQMLLTSMRGTFIDDPNPKQTWQIINFADENPEKGLVYSIAIDDANKRVVVAFRGSLSTQDWLANFNFLPYIEANPLAGEMIDREGLTGMAQPKNLVMHRGFHNYVFGANEDSEATKFNIIFEQLTEVLQERPDYDVYTTGISLGGALSTVFALHAAANKDDRIPKPITCYSFGSPKVGALSFRQAFQSLETSGRIRSLRVANQGDLIKELPYSPYRVCQGITAMCEQRSLYRQAGMALFLHEESGFSFQYYSLTRNWWKILCDDWSHQNSIFRNIIKHSCTTTPSSIKHHHGYPEYLHRLEKNREDLRQKYVNELYEEAKEKTVPFHCFLTRFCFPVKRKQGEVLMQYH